MNKLKRIIGAFIFALVFVSHAAQVKFQAEEWKGATPEKVGINSAKFKAALDELSKFMPLDEAVIVVNGQIIFRGSKADNTHRVWSAAKSFTSTTAGLLIDSKQLKLNQNVSDLLPSLKSEYGDITIEQLLTMQSGYRAKNSRYRGENGGDGSLTYWDPETKNFDAGKEWRYSDDGMNLLGLAMSTAAGENFGNIFEKRIARPLGMSSFKWDSSENNTKMPVSSGSGNGAALHVSAEDMAKFGQLFLNGGVWNGQQLLSKTWVENATKNQVPSNTPTLKSNFDGPGHYGYNWWVNGAENPMWPNAPEKTFAAKGTNNNLCIVVPEWKMVISRTNETSEAPADKALNTFFGRLADIMPKQSESESIKIAGRVSNEKLCKLSGTQNKWQSLQLDCIGPRSSELDEMNPFSDYRMDVIFKCGNKIYKVPGFFAADGKSGNTGAKDGKVWRVNFRPDEEGNCSYKVSFLQGKDIAITSDAGKALAFHGQEGSFSVGPALRSDDQKDFTNKGFLKYSGERALRFSDGQHFLKMGSSDPENFLAYREFDNTFYTGKEGGDGYTHTYSPHIKDWKPRDPSWGNEQGKGIIGAINYMSSQGINTQYMITNNVDGGDGNDTFPWTSPEEKTRFDVSKLDQWNMVFDHMDKKGVAMHLVMEERENDNVLDGGLLGKERKLYYRELIARFGHHPAILWNLGEETNHKPERLKEFAAYFKSVDPYQHPVLVHTGPKQKERIYAGLLGDTNIDGASLQVNAEEILNEKAKSPIKVAPDYSVQRWSYWSTRFNHPWVVTLDEPGTAVKTGLSDRDDPEHTIERQKFIWPSMIAGAAGFELITNGRDGSLRLEDYRTREKLWTQAKVAYDFFTRNRIPFWDRQLDYAKDQAVPSNIFKTDRNEFILYRSTRDPNFRVSLPEGKYRVQWYNPRVGGNLFNGSIETFGTKGANKGWGEKGLGDPPNELDKDWVAVIFPDDSTPSSPAHVTAPDANGDAPLSAHQDPSNL